MSEKNSENNKNKMERGLKNRHVQIIAIAGTIGTGLFLGAGRSISLTGPSIILIYMLTGVFMRARELNKSKEPFPFLILQCITVFLLNKKKECINTFS